MKALHIITTSIALIFLSQSNHSLGHCQVPCGIYEDSLRIKLMDEHITTIEKSMQQINHLSSQTNINYNQLIRWVNNKEEHANKIQAIVSQYFLHQRIKVVNTDDAHYQLYLSNLSLLHQLSVQAMKAKQTTDLKHIQQLRELLIAFSESYFHQHHHE